MRSRIDAPFRVISVLSIMKALPLNSFGSWPTRPICFSFFTFWRNFWASVGDFFGDRGDLAFRVAFFFGAVSRWELFLLFFSLGVRRLLGDFFWAGLDELAEERDEGCFLVA